MIVKKCLKNKIETLHCVHKLKYKSKYNKFLYKFYLNSIVTLLQLFYISSRDFIFHLYHVPRHFLYCSHSSVIDPFLRTWVLSYQMDYQHLIYYLMPLFSTQPQIAPTNKTDSNMQRSYLLSMVDRVNPLNFLF